MFRILVTVNESGLRKELETGLRGVGYEVIAADDSAQALDLLKHRHIDLMLLDAVLPNMDGCALVEQLRQSGSRLPVLMLCPGSGAERCRGLRLGADDCMTKPADREELLLRIAALLRRAHAATERKLTAGQSVLSYDSFSVTRDGIQTELPRKEFLLLYKLLSNPGKAYTRRQLMDEIWDPDTESDEHTVVVHVNRLRERIQDNPDFSVRTIRGLGYKAIVTA